MGFPGITGPLIVYLSTVTVTATCLLFPNIPVHTAKLSRLLTSWTENKTSRNHSDQYFIVSAETLAYA